MSYYVVAQKDGKLVELLFVSHKTSRCEVSAFSAIRTSLVVCQVEPWQVVCQQVQVNTLPRAVIYEARWVGKPDMMIKDCLRFEYRKKGARVWEHLS